MRADANTRQGNTLLRRTKVLPSHPPHRLRQLVEHFLPTLLDLLRYDAVGGSIESLANFNHQVIPENPLNCLLVFFVLLSLLLRLAFLLLCITLLGPMTSSPLLIFEITALCVLLISIRSAWYQGVSDVAATSLAESVGVVRWHCVRHTFCSTGVSVVQTVSLVIC